MFDFNYTTHYAEYIHNRSGGCRLERHKFAHIETPLDREGYSGVFIIGKLIDDIGQNGQKTGLQSLCLTAFIIARGQTLFVPGGTIHTNDYQRGTWRTYLEVADIDICDLVRPSSTNKKQNDHIELRFYCGLTKKRMAQYDLHAVNIKDNPLKTPKADHIKNHSWTINQITRQQSEQKGIEDDDEDDDDGMIYYCECGTEMDLCQVRNCYGGDPVICDGCGLTMQSAEIMVFHCPNGRNRKKHKDGYDLCQICAATSRSILNRNRKRKADLLGFKENEDSNLQHLSSQIFNQSITE